VPSKKTLPTFGGNEETLGRHGNEHVILF